MPKGDGTYTVTLAEAVNTDQTESTQYVTPDESLMLFSRSDDPSGLGEDDIFVSYNRDGGRVVNKALVIAHGVHETGRREILSIDVGEAETEAFWTDFLRGLVKRGLVGVQLAISDAHAGLKAAIAKVLGCAWQRCTVHFLRDMLGHVAKTQQPMIAAAIGCSEAFSTAPTSRSTIALSQTSTPEGSRLSSPAFHPVMFASTAIKPNPATRLRRVDLPEPEKPVSQMTAPR